MEQSERICSPDYLPSEDDVIKARIKTVGLTEAEFESEGYLWRFTDVGGQRNGK